MAEKDVEWTNEQVIGLVKEYKSKGMLWDPNHDLYRVQTAKYEAWCELADLYGCEITDLRKKFNSIFASHRREKAKVRLGGKTNWFLYSHLKFLPSHIECVESEDSTETGIMVEWTRKKIIKLIREYKARPMLWNPRHNLYRISTAKNKRWCELADMFQCSISVLRKKLHSIFASYRREKSKIYAGRRSKWFLYDHLSYLPSFVVNQGSHKTSTTRKRIKTSIEEEPPEETHDDPSSDESDEQVGSSSPVHIIVKEEPELMTKTPPKFFRTKANPNRVLKRRLINENQIDRNNLLERKLFKRSKLYKKKDECDSFGEYIAISLRKHDERTRSMIKQAINNILFEQEMKKYNAGQYTVLYTGIDENPLIVPDDNDK